MFTSPEQFIETQKAGLISLLGLTHKSFENVEKAVELNMNTAKSYLDESTASVKALLAAKDVQEFMNVSSSIGQPFAEKTVSYGKEVYQLASDMAAENSKLVEDKVAEANKQFVEMFEAASKNAPAGSEGAVALVKSAMSAANSAYDTISRAAKQAVELAESNVATATQATVKATKTAQPKKAA